ncbi:MAG: SMP-30/gluconolactonase/LRE family protein [Gammaproteobacteria bacterium]|nr:SMP-30/gluconolactonase/LRE family protein [Gammaproteobacteria bacterium]NNM01012.1 SMP-30/gluconolactonase/LRE family protein [Gammaproteobacteria bacterium]
MDNPVFTTVADGLRFPEGPVALPGGSVAVCEIAAGRVTLVAADGATDCLAETGGGPNGAALGPDGAMYVCNNGGAEWIKVDGLLYPAGIADDYSGGRIERVDIATGAVTILYAECDGRPLKGPNDIVFDAAGGFWFTDTGKSYARSADKGSVFYARIDGSHIEEVIFPLDMPNGIGLAPDGATLYVAETMTARLWHYPLAGPGRLAAPPRPFDPANFLYGAGGLSGFDSLCVEAGGNVCQATLFSGGLSVISPRGELAAFIELPDPLVTNACFGGAALDQLYATLSGTGRLVRCSWPRAGLALAHAPPPG